MVAYLDQNGTQHLIRKIRDAFWPVGTILATTSNTSPASYLGGSWELYASGRTLVGMDANDSDFTLGKTGGSKTFDVGRSTDVSAGVSIDSGANIHVAWNGYSGTNNFSNSAQFDAGFALETHSGINWNRHERVSGVKVFGTLNVMNPYQTVTYYRRVA